MTDSEERRFQEVLASLNTRESSTLTIATVASSASLVLYGLSLNMQNVISYFAGVLFPIAGFVYRELTIFSTDRSNYLELVRLVRVSRPLPSKLNFVVSFLRGWTLNILHFPYRDVPFLCGWRQAGLLVYQAHTSNSHDRLLGNCFTLDICLMSG